MRGNDFDFNNPDDIRRVMAQVREQVLRYRSWIFRGLLVVLVLLLFATATTRSSPTRSDWSPASARFRHDGAWPHFSCLSLDRVTACRSSASSRKSSASAR